MTWLPAHDVPPIDEGGCQVWWASPLMSDLWHQRLLDPVERGRRERLRRAADRDRFTVAVALTRRVLGAHLGVAPPAVRIDRTCPRCQEPHGKPRLTDSPAAFEFSISHSGDRVAVAVTAGPPVGVDVEQLADPRRLAGLGHHVLSPAETPELDRLGAHEYARGLLRYWTRKEAVLKATGDGLTQALPNLTVSAPDQPPRLLRWTTRPDIPAQLALYDLNPGNGYLASLATLDPTPSVITEFDATGVLSEPEKDIGESRP
ncbi:MAG: 4'-phosphopantetheinyl transferase family protein [Egibacteraceae bacterium]